MSAGTESPDLRTDAPPSRSGVLQDLTRELEELWAEGDSVHAELFFDRNPELLENKSQVLNWAFEQYCQLADQGSAPDPDEYCARFPRFQHSLRRRIQCFSFAQKNSSLFGDAAALMWPEAGEHFLGFALQRELGRGSFARVFLAHEPALGNRRVAIKLSRFGLTEAQALGKLDHPNVVPVYSVHRHEESGLSVVCMPYLGSATLCDLLDRAFAGGRRPERAAVILEAAKDVHQAREPESYGQRPHPLLQTATYVEGIVHLGAQLADALAYMHAQGICHRDLKPSNVLLTPDGRPMVLDFNLCSDEQAAEQVQGGTFPYMAPEQLRAVRDRKDLAPPDARADLFALGVILYELLAGRYPFGTVPCRASTEELTEHLLRQQQAGPAPLRQANPRVDQGLARLVQRCLACDPSQRPADAAELATELRRYLSAAQRARRWLRRHVVAVAAAGCLVLLTGAAAVAAVARERPQAAPVELPQDAVQQDLLAEGLTAYEQRNYFQAIQLFSTEIERDLANGLTSSPAYFPRGRSYQKTAEARIAAGQSLQEVQGLFDQAQRDFGNADRQATPDGRARAGRAYCLGRMPSHDLAIMWNTKAIEAGFRTAAVYNNRGYSYSKKQEAWEALRDLNEALRLDPNLQVSYHNRACVYLQIAQRPSPPPPLDPVFKEAGVSRGDDWKQQFASLGRKDIQQALDLGPHSGDLYVKAALLAGTVGEPQKAQDYLGLAHQRGKNLATYQHDQAFATFAKKAEFAYLFTPPADVQKPMLQSPQLLDPVSD